MSSHSGNIEALSLTNTNENVINHEILGPFNCLKGQTVAENSPAQLGDSKIRPKLTKEENALVQLVATYQDVIYCQRTPVNEASLQRSYCLHVLRHISQAKKVIRSNDKLLEAAKKNGSSNALKTSGFNDHGFHRCRCLILLPTRNYCLQVVETLQSLLKSSKGVSNITLTNRQRFYEEFGERKGGQEEDEGARELNDEELLAHRKASDEEDDVSSSDGRYQHAKQPPRKRRRVDEKNDKDLEGVKDTAAGSIISRKPLDYQSWFRGNTHDNFRLGLSLTKRSVNLYTPFEESDIIIASPLGLKFILDGHDDVLKSLDFLSSVEVLILDVMELLLMQNWHYVVQVLQRINQMPSKIQLKCPLWRVKSHFLKNEGALHRQLLAFSSIEHAWICHLIALFATNERAPLCYFPFSWKLARESIVASAKIQKKSLSIVPHPLDGNPYQPQLLKGRRPALKVKCIPVYLPSSAKSLNLGEQLMQLTQSRLNTFQASILPRLTKGSHPGILIYVPSYFDLVHVRHLLNKNSLDFVAVTEYTAEDEADRRLTQFHQSRVRILLLSERFHFYTRRRRITGIKNLIFYSPPTFPQFWHDFVDMMQTPVDDQFLILQYCAALESSQLTAFLGVDFLRRLAWEPSTVQKENK